MAVGQVGGVRAAGQAAQDVAKPEQHQTRQHDQHEMEDRGRAFRHFQRHSGVAIARAVVKSGQRQHRIGQQVVDREDHREHIDHMARVVPRAAADLDCVIGDGVMRKQLAAKPAATEQDDRCNRHRIKERQGPRPRQLGRLDRTDRQIDADHRYEDLPQRGDEHHDRTRIFRRPGRKPRGQHPNPRPPEDQDHQRGQQIGADHRQARHHVRPCAAFLIVRPDFTEDPLSQPDPVLGG